MTKNYRVYMSGDIWKMPNVRSVLKYNMSGLTSRKALNNFIWIIASKVIQSVLGLVISVYTARYLGTANYGVINYVASLVNFVLPIAQLGLSAVIIQEIINGKDKEGEIVGSAIAISFISSVLCYIGILFFTFFVNKGERETLICCAVYGISLFFQAMQLINYWFQAVLLSKHIGVLSIIAYIVVSGYKIFLLICKADVYWFALSYSIDYGIISIGGILYFKKITGKSIGIDKKICKDLLAKGKYFILSGIMVTIFGQTDKIMLKLMIDDSATGVYSAALICAGLTGFVFVATIDSIRPIILESKLIDEKAFEKNIVFLFSIIVYMSILIGGFTFIFSDEIIWILYGKDFMSASNVLKVLAWEPLFSYWGVGRDIWLIANNQHSKVWILNLCGAVMNIVLNIFFIQYYGIIGAAVASFISKVFTYFVLVVMIKSISRCGYLMVQSLNPKIILSVMMDKIRND